MKVSVITVLASGEHLHFQAQAPDDIEAAVDGVIADHINARLEAVDTVKRFVIVAADLSWKVDVGLGQHLQYAPAPQLVAEISR
jgi:hypothetical protein